MSIDVALMPLDEIDRGSAVGFDRVESPEAPRQFQTEESGARVEFNRMLTSNFRVGDRASPVTTGIEAQILDSSKKKEGAMTHHDHGGIISTVGACTGAFCDGAWNVLAQGRKLAGTAQRWRATPQGRVALIHAAILTRTPDETLWPVLQNLQQVALPTEPLPQLDTHIAMDELMPGKMNFTSFPGALVRAAEDRLMTLAHQNKEAA